MLSFGKINLKTIISAIMIFHSTNINYFQNETYTKHNLKRKTLCPLFSSNTKLIKYYPKHKLIILFKL